MNPPKPNTSAAADHLESVLQEARKRVEVDLSELDAARERRDDIADALRTAFPDAPIYLNGSVAHGDALTPLTDVDLGVIVPDPDGKYGPGKFGPSSLQAIAADAIRIGLKEKYGDLRVELQGRKRSILVRFRDPIRPGWQDFTADVIVAIDNPTGDGLYIPRHQAWDRSHPQKHTELVRVARQQTDVTYAQVVRLLKHWNRQNGKPLVSWHVKVLALRCIDRPTRMLDGLQVWFDHAYEAIKDGPVPDPARVSGPVDVAPGTKTDVLRRLKSAQDGIAKAVQYAQEGYPTLAVDELAKIFNDAEMLPPPSPESVKAEYAARLKTITSAVPTTVSVATPPPVRSWGV